MSPQPYPRQCMWAVLLALLLSACRAPVTPSTSNSPLLVVASILPLADFARQVGGTRVQVEALVPAGVSPHTYELRPAQPGAVSRARLLVLNGLGLEYWAADLISAADNPDLVVVTTAEGIDIIAGDENQPGGNPHVWLSPLGAMHQVEMIRDALIQADPAGEDAYRANAERYLSELEGLDAEIREAVTGFTSRQFIAYHAAWVYFARDYGLEQAAVVEPTPGAEPSPAEIAAIIQTAKAIGAKAIFAEPQFSPKAAEVIAEESGARVLFLNPLGLPPDYSYLALMRYNLGEMAKALKWGDMTGTAAPIIELDHVQVAFQDVTVLEDVSLSVPAGAFLAIIGPNGAGKTTLLRVILGLVRPESGTVRVFGRAPWELGGERRRIGYVPQVPTVDLNFPVRAGEAVLMGRYGRIGLVRRPGADDRVAALAAMERVGIADLADRPLGRLSGGQRQRVFLARALANEPELLLLDEPTTGVDVAATESLYERLRGFHEMGMTILVVSHDVGVIASYVDGVACVNRRLVAHGRPEEVLSSEALTQMYGCEAMFFHHGRVLHLVVERER